MFISALKLDTLTQESMGLIQCRSQPQVVTRGTAGSSMRSHHISGPELPETKLVYRLGTRSRSSQKKKKKYHSTTEELPDSLES